VFQRADLQSAVGLAPAVEGLVRDADLLAGLGSAPALAQQRIVVAELADDLL